MIDPDATSDSRRRPDAKGGAGIVMDSVRGPFLMRVTYAFEDDAGRGHAGAQSGRGRGDAVLRADGAADGGAVRRSLTRDLATLKRILEGRG